MVTVQTLGFQPLNTALVERNVPSCGGIFILAKKTASMELIPFLIRNAQNLKESLRDMLLRESAHPKLLQAKRSIDDRVNRVWVRIISIEGHNHRAEIEKVLTSELLGDDGAPSETDKRPE